MIGMQVYNIHYVIIYSHMLYLLPFDMGKLCLKRSQMQQANIWTHDSI